MKPLLRWLVLAVILGVVLASSAFFSFSPFVHRGNGELAAHAAGISRAAPSTPIIQPSTSIIRPFRHIPVSASGFSANDQVSMFLDNINNYKLIGVLSCDSQGNCSGNLYTNQYTATAGSHILLGQGASSMAQAAVTVLAGISASPNKGGQGTSIEVSGAAFALNETVSIYWGDPTTGILEGTVTSDSYQGSLFLTFTSPAGTPSGRYPITALRNHQKPGVVMTWFTLQAPHMHVLTPGVHAGKSLALEVTGFQASEQVTLSWSANGGQTLATFFTYATGFGGDSLIPPSALPGNYTLTAVGMSSGLQAQGSISIGPGIGLSSPQASVGQTINVTGGGFSAHETIDVYLQNTSLGVVTTASDAIGNFTVSLTLPDTFAQKQTYHVFAVSASNSEMAKVLFTFDIPGVDLLDQYTSYGSPNLVYGFNFLPGETVKLFWDYKQSTQIILPTVTADSTGSFNLPIITPSEPNLSSVTLTSIGLTSKIINTNPVYEYPGLVLNPASGPVESKVHVSVGGFDAGETVTISLLAQNTVMLATATTDKFGHFTTSFVPPLGIAPSSYDIEALGSTSQLRADAFFAVIPTVIITPNTGPSNTEITVVGSSFLPTETVKIWWFDNYTNSNYLLKTVTTTQHGTFKTHVQAEGNLVSGNTYYIEATDQLGGSSYYGQAAFTAQ